MLIASCKSIFSTASFESLTNIKTVARTRQEDIVCTVKFIHSIAHLKHETMKKVARHDFAKNAKEVARGPNNWFTEPPAQMLIKLA